MTVYGAQNANGLLFFEMMFVAMRAMLGALFTFPPNFKIMVKVCAHLLQASRPSAALLPMLLFASPCRTAALCPAPAGRAWRAVF